MVVESCIKYVSIVVESCIKYVPMAVESWKGRYRYADPEDPEELDPYGRAAHAGVFLGEESFGILVKEGSFHQPLV